MSLGFTWQQGESLPRKSFNLNRNPEKGERKMIKCFSLGIACMVITVFMGLAFPRGFNVLTDILVNVFGVISLLLIVKAIAKVPTPDKERGK
ncbi:hypothetical protein LCGC14_0627790 [marine sediment metagenome]|uniref:Uncharacterized protein n=1 Tax=marine sediment metagenome TaxID=412755 RepID=A0A0F9R7Z1_9ZZZZ